MNWLDIFVLVTVVGLALAGLMKGAVKLVMPMLGLAVGVVAAMRYYRSLANLFTSGDSSMARFVAFAVILVAILVVTAIIANMLTKALSLIMLGWLNRLAGVAAGIVLGVVISLVLILLASKYMDLQATLQESKLASRLLDYLPFVLRLVPEDFRRVADFLTR